MTTAILNNRYRILQSLARGGFGETFLAEDTHLPSTRKCVIKLLKPAVESLGKEQWVKIRFQKEAAILEELGKHHSQIPELYAYFSEGDNFYLVQEWIEGETLRQKLELQGVFSLELVKEILINLLPVLDYIHSKKIIHRDIKPDNIILRASDGKPVLIDFGAVKQALNNTTGNQANGAVSFAIGTPGYMPSEQAAGRPLYSSDLYSVGLTAIYLLTGKSPEELQINSKTGEILWRSELPSLHSNLAAVIDKAIRFHPSDRFSCAKEMFYALQPEEPPTVTQATILVAPGKLPTKEQKSETLLIQNEEEKEDSPFKLLLPLILLGGIGLGGLTIGFSLFLPKQREVIINRQPTIEETQPSPEPIIVETPPEQTDTTEQPEATIPETESPPPETPQESNKPENQPPQELPKNIGDVPTFAVGTTENEILSVLGEPTSKRKGYWHNTTAWVYQDLIDGEVDIGYVFDNETAKVRQTEVSFAQSVDVQVMKNTLDKLLLTDAPKSVKEGLEQIYRGETDRRTFTVGSLKGMIQRNAKNEIYIGIWDTNFH